MCVKSPLDRIVEYATKELERYEYDVEGRCSSTSCYEAVAEVLALAGTPEALDALYKSLLEDRDCVRTFLLQAFYTADNAMQDYLIEKLNAPGTTDEQRPQILYALHACWEDEKTMKAIEPYMASDNPYIRGAAEGFHDPVW